MFVWKLDRGLLVRENDMFYKLNRHSNSLLFCSNSLFSIELLAWLIFDYLISYNRSNWTRVLTSSQLIKFSFLCQGKKITILACKRSCDFALQWTVPDITDIQAMLWAIYQLSQLTRNCQCCSLPLIRYCLRYLRVRKTKYKAVQNNAKCDKYTVPRSEMYIAVQYTWTWSKV